MGIPVIACTCGVCQSDSSYNKRLRPSALVTVGGKSILIDPGPDLRQQALTHNIKHLDGIIITHAHYDHTSGIDELRAFRQAGVPPIEIAMSNDTLIEVSSRFYYIFDNEKLSKSLTPQFILTLFPENQGEITFQGTQWKYFTFFQAGMPVNGLRIGNLAYVSDIYNYDDSIFTHLQGIETLIISALRFTPSAMHFSVDQAVDFAKKTGAKQTWLTHISHDLEHQKTNAYLPEAIQLAYDGLIIDF